jgi:hypothetical protein
VPRCQPTPARSGSGVARRLSRARRAVAAAAVVATALFLSGCSSANGDRLAKEACSHVERSLAIYGQSLKETSSSRAASERAAALQQLRVALPIAATAAGQTTQWQALMTTLSESTRLPESTLVYALRAQCAVAASGSAPTPT